MASITRKSLEDLETLNREALYVLLRFYLEVDKEIPEKFQPVLLGEVPFKISYNPKNVAEYISEVLLSIVYMALQREGQHAFMMKTDDDVWVLMDSTKKALQAYITKHQPLDKAVLLTYEEWVKTDTYKNRHGKWDGFI